MPLGTREVADNGEDFSVTRGLFDSCALLGAREVEDTAEEFSVTRGICHPCALVRAGDDEDAIEGFSATFDSLFDAPESILVELIVGGLDKGSLASSHWCML
eukprot:GEMP01113800.1.p2 GENE.GEMP01113800.1~~GEMP01113800.1.p2  ORF type:complete len:102 (-),score=14.76 GEMP01113800.1:275-580(-)